jgi:hypothetical protein
VWVRLPRSHRPAVPGTWRATDPVLAALRAARARHDQADRDIRILLAYARRARHPPPLPARRPGRSHRQIHLRRPHRLHPSRRRDRPAHRADLRRSQDARQFGYSWADIAARLGITRQGAQQRWAEDTPATFTTPDGTRSGGSRP